MPFTLVRTQFSVKLCFAMTINESQCQSLDRVGLCLTESNQCFSHGQLYVALSRVTGGPAVLAMLKTNKATNVVFEEFFSL